MFFPIVVSSQVAQGQNGDKDLLTTAEEMPYFPGCADLPQGSPEKRSCSDENLVAFIADYLEYPEEAKKSGIEGTVYVSFTIDQEGRVQHPKLRRDIGSGCGEEALRIVQNMPRWEPARQAGKPVNVQLTLPVNFFLTSDNEEASGVFTIHWGDIKGEKVAKQQLLENLDNPVIIRDEMGDAVEIDELTFAYRKHKKVFSAESRGAITPEMLKILKKVKKGGTFVIMATIQESGQFIETERIFEIIAQ